VVPPVVVAPDPATTLDTSPRLLLIAPHSSYRISPYLDAAQRLGVKVLVASTSEHSLVSAVAEGLRIDLDDPDAALVRLLAEAERQAFVGVVGTDDSAVALTARVAEALGLPHNPPQAAQLTQRKDLARARLTRNGLPAPWHQRVDLQGDLDTQAARLDYPCVIKPLSLSGSRGVIRANNAEEFISAAQRVRNIIAEQSDVELRRYALVEAYLPGTEVAVEGMLDNGQFQLLAIFDKPEPLEGPYFEESYYITPSRLPTETQNLIAQCTREACAAYGLQQGPVHAELRLHDNEAWILEVAARTIGGQCARLLRYGTGHDLETLVIAQAVGKTLPHKKTDEAAGVLMIPIPRGGILRRVEGLGAARRVPGVVDIEISVREGYELIPLPEGAAYLGFIFAQAASPTAVEQALREAHNHLNIVTAPLWKLA
jgi:biotin carboxylase